MEADAGAARAGEASPPADDQARLVFEGVEVVSFSTVVEKLRSEYPGLTIARIESVLLREWEAFAAGRPLVVPVAIEDGVREILDQS